MKKFLSAFISGALIAMGCGIYKLSGGGIVGAILFCVGLLTICTFSLDLYTGRVGFMLYDDRIDWKTLGIILFGNLIGTLFMGTFLGLTMPGLTEQAAEVIQSLGWVKTIGGSFICGALMFLAVALYKEKTPIGIFLCVVSFLMSGFVHSIALAGYICISMEYTWFSLAHLAIAIVGNASGAVLFAYTILSTKETKNE